ncbi:DUF6463 family protein [Nannocystis exedens]|uniref:DUF6463 family protein n=1 Tax=Nannocystis exedens TaxID=54 RepID=UPI000BBA01A6|nr:DUF6463 family protein [Nannocystis exedens]PCC68560.1 hypothetical protein NAEX_01576 [Nannocystis exedens]
MEHTRAYGVGAGTLLFWTGVVHQAFGLTVGGGIALEIVRDGYVGAVEVSRDREVVFWFLVAGVLMMIGGRALARLERERPLPREFGGWLLALALLGGLAIPASGFWLALPMAALVFARARR